MQLSIHLEELHNKKKERKYNDNSILTARNER